MEDFLVKVIGDSVSFSFPPFKGTLYTCSLQHSGALREKAAYNYLFRVYLCMYTSKLVLAHLQQPPQTLQLNNTLSSTASLDPTVKQHLIINSLLRPYS